jgi:hypothetical protein
MILHLGFDVCVEADKVMKHIAQLCKSQIKKASQSVCGIPLADGNEQESIGKSNSLFHQRRAPTLSPTPRPRKPPPRRSPVRSAREAARRPLCAAR